MIFNFKKIKLFYNFYINPTNILFKKDILLY